MKRYILLLFLFSTFGTSSLFAGNQLLQNNVRTTKQTMHPKDWSFTENKGQLSSDIQYYGQQGGVFLYCRPSTISFVFTKTENDPKQISEATGGALGDGQNFDANHFRPRNSQFATRSSALSTNRADLILLNANLSAPIVASEQQEYEQNYYLAHTGESGITNVHSYKTITYNDIYPRIDFVLHAKEQGLKYEFVVHPGGKVSDIQLQWNGLQNMQLAENGGISYALPLGKMEESKPASFQGNREVASTFIKKDHTIGFEMGKYDPRATLVIDPNIVWGTYFGNEGNDIGSAITTDANGNVFIAGYTESTQGLATAGAYQTSFAGAYDAFLAKFNSNGERLWATYYGGNDLEFGFGVCLDGTGGVYMTGTTYSTSGIATSGAYQTTVSTASTDHGFLARFNGSGKRIWSTYFAGNYSDESKGVAADDSGHVYITGYTGSSQGIATKGAYQTSNAGYNNVFLAKFDSSGSIQWSTYYGSNSDDRGFAIAYDHHAGDIYIGGAASGPGAATSGAYQTSYSGGDWDGLLIKFSSAGKLKWATYFGDKGYDQGAAVTADGNGHVYFAGYTGSTSGIATTGAYQTALSGSLDAFLAAFNADGTINWATYFGGADVDEASGIALDKASNIYLTGQTQSSSGLATKGAYQTSYGGGGDVFLSKFNPGGILQWATYYGGFGLEECNGISVNATGIVNIVGNTMSTNNISTQNAFQPSFVGGTDTFDVFLAQFSFLNTDAGIANIISPKGSQCQLPMQFKVTLKNFGDDVLNSVQIGWSVNGKKQTAHSWTGKLKPDSTQIVNLDTILLPPGMDTLLAWTYLPNGGNDSLKSNDTSIFYYQVEPLPVIKIAANQTICAGDTIDLGSKGIAGIVYQWHVLYSTFDTSAPNPRVQPDTTTTYILNEFSTVTGCQSTDSVKITVNPVPIAGWNIKIDCDSAYYIPQINTYKAYKWHFGDNDSSAVISPEHTFATKGTFQTRLVVADAKGCHAERDSQISISCLSGISENTAPHIELSLFPNPFSFTTTLSYTVVEKSEVRIELLDIMGRQIALVYSGVQASGRHQYEINTESCHLQQGVYLMKFVANGSVVEQRLVKY